MKKNKKVLLGGLALVVVLGIAFFANSGEFFKGNLNTVSGSSSSNTASTSLGTLSFAPSFNPVLDDKAVAGAQSSANQLLVARYRIFATGEPFIVNQLTVTNDSGNPRVNNGAVTAVYLVYPTQMSAPTTLDGMQAATLSGGVATFTNLIIAVPASVSDENSINVEVRVTTAGIGSGTMQGNHVELDLNGSYTAIGQASGGIATGSALLDAPQIALYKSIPTFAKHTASTAACPTSNLVSSSQSPVYCFSVTASPQGPVGLRKLTFDVVPSLLNVSNAAGGLRAPNGFKLYQYDASGNVSTTVSGQGTWSPNSNKAYINIVPETVIPAGATSYFVLRAPITFIASPDASNISTRLSEEPSSYNTAHQSSTSVALAAPNRFNIWSDRSAASHSFNTADWTHSYKLDGLPSAYLFLSE